MNSKKIGTYISYILRHDPDAIGIEINDQGWVKIEDLIVKSEKNNKVKKVIFTHEELMEAVKKDDKQRFQVSNGMIRAVQGHTTSYVDIAFDKKIPPKILYHGTATRFLDSIMEKGLIPVNRHYVHLSSSIETAKKVGARHGELVVLEVSAKEMSDEGKIFYQSENKVWLTDAVPVKNLSILPESKYKSKFKP